MVDYQISVDMVRTMSITVINIAAVTLVLREHYLAAWITWGVAAWLCVVTCILSLR